MIITDHFRLYEFHQKEGHGQPAAWYPKEWIQERLYPLCRLLEGIRIACGNRPMKIISGYRSPEYNKLLPGAAKNSQHMQGKAADFVVEEMYPYDVWDVCRELHNDGTLVIKGLGKYSGFTHVDIREGPTARWTGSKKRTA